MRHHVSIRHRNPPSRPAFFRVLALPGIFDFRDVHAELAAVSFPGPSWKYCTSCSVFKTTVIILWRRKRRKARK